MFAHDINVENVVSKLVFIRQTKIPERERELFYIKMMRLYNLKELKPYFPRDTIYDVDKDLFNTNREEFYLSFEKEIKKSKK